MNQSKSKQCTLRLVARGEAAVCPEDRCAFWEPGGAVLDGSCLVERFGIDAGDVDLAAYLLEALERVERARDLAEAGRAHSAFGRRLGPVHLNGEGRNKR